MGQILIRQPDGSWREPVLAGYAAESELQGILAQHPELIPGVSADAATCREFQSAAGPADVVVVDNNGEVTLVECKLATNPQIRREIVGQMFDYASRLWRLGIEEFEARWQDRTGQLLFSSASDGDGATRRDAVEHNLAEGRFRIVLAVDAINEPLKRMTEYLNAMSGPGTSIIAVEYVRLLQGTMEILSAQTYGQELAEAKSAAARADRTLWDVGNFRAWLEANEPVSVPNFLAFASEAESMGLEFSGSLSVAPSTGLRISDGQGRWLGTVSLFHFSGQGTSIEFNFIRLSKMLADEMPAATALEAFLDEMSTIPGLQEVGENLRSTWFTTRRPNVSLAALEEESVRRGLRAVTILQGTGGFIR